MADLDRNSTASPKRLPLESSLSRRNLLSWALGAGLLGGVPAQLLAQPSPPQSKHAATSHPRKRTGLLVRHSDLDQLHTRSKIVVELEGELQLKEPDPNKPETLRSAEVKAKSTLDYFEKIAFTNSELAASARRYVEAKLENWIRGSASSSELRPVCRETRMAFHEGLWQQYCENEPLDVRETELVRAPINSAVLELLLPTTPAKPSSTWTIDETAARMLFNLDAVHESTLTARIVKVEKGVASIAVSGNLKATANSVPTELAIRGNFNAEFGSRCALVTWLGLAIQETREISQSEPGFAITARVRLIRAETQNEFPISADKLRAIAEVEDEGRWLVRLHSTSGRYSMLGDRRWKTYLDTGEEAILRLIENNTVIAQCNITRLPKLDAGSQLTLEGMQNDIRKSLGDGFERFLESNEKLTSGNLRLLRSVVMGEAEEVPVQWIYNHLSDDSGRRIAMIYTMGGNLTDRFAAADEQMTASFELLPEAESSANTPTPAPATKLSSEKPTQTTR